MTQECRRCPLLAAELQMLRGQVRATAALITVELEVKATMGRRDLLLYVRARLEDAAGG